MSGRALLKDRSIQAALYLVLALLIVLLVALVRQAAVAPADQSTPEAAVRSYYAALDTGDLRQVRALLDRKDPSSKRFLTNYGKVWRQGYRWITRDLEVYIVANKGSWAVARTSQIEALRAGDLTFEEYPTGGFLGLVKREGKWYVVESPDVGNDPDWRPVE